MVGLSLVLAAGLLLQESSWVDSAEQYGGPVLNLALSATGHDKVAASGSDASVATVVAFVLGFVLLSFGTCLLAIGAVWSTVRWAPRRRARRRIRQAQPAVARAGEQTRQLVSATRPKVAAATQEALSTTRKHSRAGIEAGLPVAAAAAQRGRDRLRGVVDRRKGRDPAPSIAVPDPVPELAPAGEVGPLPARDVPPPGP